MTWDLSPSLLRFGNATDPDDLVGIRRREKEISETKDRWQKQLQEKTTLKSALGKGKVVSSLKEQYRDVTATAKETRNELARLKASLQRFQVSVNGERELFDEYVFRAGKTDSRDSWRILAEMRHHGVPTRLLDWTDRLDIALYFALDSYRNAAIQPLTGPLPTPCIWVLNPYRLSRRSSRKKSLWNVNHHPDLDYYERFHRKRDWPFDEPLPIFPPVPLERIRSQRGYFTVLGNNKEAMNQLLSTGIKSLERVEVPPDAAKFSIEYLTSVQRLTEFEVFRDLDSLGRELSGWFVKLQGETYARMKKRAEQ